MAHEVQLHRHPHTVHRCSALVHSPFLNSAQAQAAGPNPNSWCRSARTLCRCSASTATAERHAAHGHHSSRATMPALRRAPARKLLGARAAELELVGVCALGRLSPCGQGQQQG